jgi:hypothetical protein
MELWKRAELGERELETRGSDRFEPDFDTGERRRRERVGREE